MYNHLRAYAGDRTICGIENPDPSTAKVHPRQGIDCPRCLNLMANRQYCAVCNRPFAQVNINPQTGECGHGAYSPQPPAFTGGLDLTPEQLAAMYPEYYGG